MNHVVTLLMVTMVGAVIGWITNIFAIKLLFRPLTPIRIPFTPFTIVGLIPKRRNEIATTIAEVVSQELLSVDDLINETITDEDLQQIKGYVKEKIKVVIDEKTAMIPFPFKGMIQGPVEQMIDHEVDQGLNEVMINIKEMVKTRLTIEELIERNINALDLEELERLVLKIAKKELRHIEWLGFFLGGIIGLIQGILLMYI